jgi:predicted GH43/DUF377 family glycosyl hydrolase
MINLIKEGIILSKTDIEFENGAVLNPAVIRVGDSVHIFYRAVKEGNYSSIGYCRLDGPLTLMERWDKPIMVPEFEYESKGVEDARIVKIDDLYYLTYTAYDGVNARGALATSKDLIHFEKQGIIVPNITYSEFVQMAQSLKVNKNYYQNHKFYYKKSDPLKKTILWDKNVILFPRRINGNLVFLHRIRPGIQIVSIKEINELTKEFWIEYFSCFTKHIVFDPIYEHESSYIGGGCPPIETPEGWLLIYHGVEDENGPVYRACAALLDLDDPSKILARLPYPLFSPEYEWELYGDVNNVVFPTGTAVFGGTLFIYYGAADKEIAVARINLSELIAELLNHKSTKL